MSKRAAGEGHVGRRPDGLWEARISIPGGKPKSFYGKTQAEALRKRNEFKAAYLGGGLDFDADRITFGEGENLRSSGVPRTGPPRAHPRICATLKAHGRPPPGPLPA